MKLKAVALILVAVLFTSTSGLCAQESISTDENASISIEELISKAEKGDTSAQTALAMAYYEGDRVPRDLAESTKWIRIAAEQGLPGAQFLLGAAYETGAGVEPDYVEAMKWYRKAAESGVADAQYAVAVLFGQGFGVDRDDTKAAKWLQKAAEQEHVGAQTRLAGMYAIGEGVDQDFDEAVRFARQAADQGSADAQHFLGTAYDEGLGVGRSYKKAVKWYRKAAEQGHVRAQADLGLMLVDGVGVQQDPIEAAKWFLLAADAGDQQAFEQALLTLLQLAPEEQQKAEELAQAWMEAHPIPNDLYDHDSETPLEARVLVSGICESRGDETNYAAPEMASGKATTVHELVITEATNLIPLGRGKGFGFSWLVAGLPATVEVTYSVEHPVMTRPDGTTYETSNESMLLTTKDGLLESTDCYSFDEEYEMLPGEWTLSILFNGDTLLTQTYNVVKLD